MILLNFEFLDKCHHDSCHLLNIVPESLAKILGQTFYTYRRGMANISHTQEGGFYINGGQTYLHRGGGTNIFVGEGGGYDDVDEEMNQSFL